MDSGKLIANGQQLAYIVTEFVSGETLDRRIAREGDLSIYEIKQVAKALLSALQYLHSQATPIIHNEVTVQNLMHYYIDGRRGEAKRIALPRYLVSWESE